MGDDSSDMGDDSIVMGDDSIDMGDDSIDMGYLVTLGCIGHTATEDVRVHDGDEVFPSLALQSHLLEFVPYL